MWRRAGKTILLFPHKLEKFPSRNRNTFSCSLTKLSCSFSFPQHSNLITCFPEVLERNSLKFSFLKKCSFIRCFSRIKKWFLVNGREEVFVIVNSLVVTHLALLTNIWKFCVINALTDFYRSYFCEWNLNLLIVKILLQAVNVLSVFFFKVLFKAVNYKLANSGLKYYHWITFMDA